MLRWTEEKNIHIATVLHQNKADFNARGHIGTSLVNKAETVISVTRDDKNRDISYVKPEFCKDRDFQMLAFTINDDGLPVLLDSPPPESSKMVNIQNIFEAILPPPKEMTQGRLADEYMKKTSLSKRTADSHIKYAVENEILIKDEVRKSYKMSYSPAPDQDEAVYDNKLFQLENEFDDAPF